MKKQKCALFLLAGVLTSASFASWQQDVTLCLNVNSTSDIPFYAAVTTTDFFDSWTYAQRVNGQTCVKESYNHGPKNFKLKIETADYVECADNAKIYADSSCSYLTKIDDLYYISGALGTGRHHEFWTFNLTQREGKEGDRFTYNLSCQHWATN